MHTVKKNRLLLFNVGEEGAAVTGAVGEEGAVVEIQTLAPIRQTRQTPPTIKINKIKAKVRRVIIVIKIKNLTSEAKSTLIFPRMPDGPVRSIGRKGNLLHTALTPWSVNGSMLWPQGPERLASLVKYLIQI